MAIDSEPCYKQLGGNLVFGNSENNTVIGNTISSNHGHGIWLFEGLDMLYFGKILEKVGL